MITSMALSDMIGFADAWASCGSERYIREERVRRNRADRVLADYREPDRRQFGPYRPAHNPYVYTGGVGIIGLLSEPMVSHIDRV